MIRLAACDSSLGDVLTGSPGHAPHLPFSPSVHASGNSERPSAFLISSLPTLFTKRQEQEK